MVSNYNKVRRLLVNESVNFKEYIFEYKRSMITYIHNRFFLIEKENNKSRINLLRIDFDDYYERFDIYPLPKNKFHLILKCECKEVQLSFNRFVDFYQNTGKMLVNINDMKSRILSKVFGLLDIMNEKEYEKEMNQLRLDDYERELYTLMRSNFIRDIKEKIKELI